MRIDEIIIKEDDKLTKTELRYLNSKYGNPTEMYKLSNGKDIIEVNVYPDGSYVKEVMNEENSFDGILVKSSKEELEEMINSNLYNNVEFNDYKGKEFSIKKII